MAIREIVVREGEISVRMDGILTAEDLERVQGQIYYNEEFIKQLNRQTFDFSEITDSTLTHSQIFYLSVMDNSALQTNPQMELIKIASSDKIIKLCHQWHQNLIRQANIKILRV